MRKYLEERASKGFARELYEEAIKQAELNVQSSEEIYSEISANSFPTITLIIKLLTALDQKMLTLKAKGRPIS